MTQNKFWALLLLPITSLTLIYVVNPSGTATNDPRGRILGAVPFHIPSSSMEPTINAGDYILASTYAYRSTPIKRNDIIVFKYPPSPNKEYVKRVVGIEGDRVSINDHNLYLNGDSIIEPFTQHVNRISKTADLEWVVPAGHVFVLGDNRDNSSDSRHWGFVSSNSIIGRVNYLFDSSERQIKKAPTF